MSVWKCTETPLPVTGKLLDRNPKVKFINSFLTGLSLWERRKIEKNKRKNNNNNEKITFNLNEKIIKIIEKLINSKKIKNIGLRVFLNIN